KSSRRTVLVVAPHPDDETLGCGGALLRHVHEGDEVYWLIMTDISEEQGFTVERVSSRANEIQRVQKEYGFKGVFRVGYPPTLLDTLPKAKLVNAISGVFNDIRPHVLYVPYRNDVHSDHAAVFDAVISCSKSFRYPSIKSVYAYETLSETEFGMRPDDPGFRPNLFIDTTCWLDKKIQIMKIFEGEMGEFPFPRSDVCIRALASLRGSQAGFHAAEAFMILKE